MEYQILKTLFLAKTRFLARPTTGKVIFYASADTCRAQEPDAQAGDDPIRGTQFGRTLRPRWRMRS
jgi:hypothetical protein